MLRPDIGGMNAAERLVQAAPTAGKPSVSTTLRMLTICQLSSSVMAILHRRIRSIAAGSTQALKGARCEAPGLRASTGT